MQTNVTNEHTRGGYQVVKSEISSLINFVRTIHLMIRFKFPSSWS
jgi:hypothetical protein